MHIVRVSLALSLYEALPGGNDSHKRRGGGNVYTLYLRLIQHIYSLMLYTRAVNVLWDSLIMALKQRPARVDFKCTDSYI